MSIKENKALVRHVVELWNRRDMDAFFKVLAPEYIEHLPTGDVSLAQLKKYAHTFFTAFPDISITINDMVAEGDEVAVMMTWRMIQKATGKKTDMTNAHIIKISTGKLMEAWSVIDVRAAQFSANPKQ